mgnify:CR=1 FL=1
MNLLMAIRMTPNHFTPGVAVLHDGVLRKVIMQAPKNGFFYVLDRSDGKLLRAHPYGRITWASHVDMDTGRPVENPDEYYDENPRWIWPGTGGAHNWQAMSFDASKGVMFIPTLELPTFFAYLPTVLILRLRLLLKLKILISRI